MKLIETLVGVSKEELLRACGLDDDAIPPPEDDRTYLEIPKQGVSFVISGVGKVTTAHLYSWGLDGYAQYQGAMPFGLDFAMTREQVRSLLGVPDRSADATLDSIFGDLKARDIYTVAEYSVSVEYMRNASGIALISISKKGGFKSEVQHLPTE